MELKLVGKDGCALRLAAVGEMRQAAFQVGPDPFRVLLDELGFARPVIVNLLGITFMDSSGIGWMLKCQKRAREAGGRVVFCSLPPAILDVVKVMRLDQVLKIAENEVAAMAMADEVQR